MQRFEIQRADLTAAKVVSNALKHYLNFEWNGVEHAISTLLAHNQGILPERIDFFNSWSIDH